MRGAFGLLDKGRGQISKPALWREMEPTTETTPSRFGRVGSSELVSSIVQRLDQLIDQGFLVPGQRLVEADLMRELNVGRIPVREALRILAGDGVVELFPNRGARIRRFEAARLADMLEAVTGVACTAMRLYCQMAAPAELTKLLLEANERIAASVRIGSPIEIMRSMIAWHHAVCVHCGNGYLLEMLERVHIEHYGRQISLSVSLDIIKQLASIYASLTEYMIKQDYPSAEALMIANMETLCNDLRR